MFTYVSIVYVFMLKQKYSRNEINWLGQSHLAIYFVLETSI